MCALTSIQMKWYGVQQWKSIVVALTIIVTGLVGAKAWFFLENGYWEGRSFYGAVYLAPITFLIVAKLVQIPYLYSLDFCATAGCLILAVLKVQCIVEGCCAGIILYLNKENMYIRFPSQIAEFFCALILTAILMYLSLKKKYRGRIYPITLILYGSTRFVLNLFRDDWTRTQAMNLVMPLGNIWSLVAVVVGVVWLLQVKYRKYGNAKT